VKFDVVRGGKNTRQRNFTFFQPSKLIFALPPSLRKRAFAQILFVVLKFVIRGKNIFFKKYRKYQNQNKKRLSILSKKINF